MIAQKCWFGLIGCILAIVFTARTAQAGPVNGLTNSQFLSQNGGNTVPGWTLNGYFLFNSPAGSPAPGNSLTILQGDTLSQTFSTQGYQFVQLDFLAQLPSSLHTDNDFVIALGNETLKLSDFSVINVGGGWYEFNGPVLSVASLGGSPLTLVFDGRDLNGDSGESVTLADPRALLTGPAVAATPEPASLAVFGGMTALGALSLRRRSGRDVARA